MENTLLAIRDFADKSHGKQMRKYTPEPYIVHPVRVMETCKKFTNALPLLAAALLHDVLEDTPVSENELSDFLKRHLSADDADETLKLVVELTDVYTKDSYPQWNREMRKKKEHGRLSTVSAQAQTIKYADIIDN